MDFSKVIWKFYFKSSPNLSTQGLFKFFNGIIPDSPEVFVDVADYSHVYRGPLVLLAGHFADLSYDTSDGEFGIQYSLKRALPGEEGKTLLSSLSALAGYTERLLKSEWFAEMTSLDTHKLFFAINDRAQASNNQESLEKLTAPLTDFLKSVFGHSNFKISQLGGEKDRLAVQIQILEGFDLAGLISKETASS